MNARSDRTQRRDASAEETRLPNRSDASRESEKPRTHPDDDPQRNPAQANDAEMERKPAPPPDDNWREHEHRTPTADVQAQRLLNETGSPELAKHAVDRLQSETESETEHEGPHQDAAADDAAARRFGYQNFAELVRDSVSLPVDRGFTFLLCELRDGRWLRFDRETWPEHELFDSRDAAMTTPHRAPPKADGA